MKEQSEILSSKKEFAFASSTILAQVGRGIIVGLVVGIIVGSFRFLIEKILSYRSRILSRPSESDTESIDHFIVLYPHLLT